MSSRPRSGRWGGTAPGDASGDTQWWPGRYSQVNPLSTLMANKGNGLPPSMADPLFTAVDPTVDPAKQTAVGAVMPYFALDYLPFTSIPIANGSERPSTGSCSMNGS